MVPSKQSNDKNMIKESEETEDSSDFCDQLEYVSDINEQEAELVPYAQNNLPNFDEFSSESVLNNGYSDYIRAYKFNKNTNIRTIDSVDLYIVWVVMIIFNATKASTDKYERKFTCLQETTHKEVDLHAEFTATPNTWLRLGSYDTIRRCISYSYSPLRDCFVSLCFVLLNLIFISAWYILKVAYYSFLKTSHWVGKAVYCAFCYLVAIFIIPFLISTLKVVYRLLSLALHWSISGVSNGIIIFACFCINVLKRLQAYFIDLFIQMLKKIVTFCMKLTFLVVKISTDKLVAVTKTIYAVSIGYMWTCLLLTWLFTKFGCAHLLSLVWYYYPLCLNKIQMCKPKRSMYSVLKPSGISLLIIARQKCFFRFKNMQWYKSIELFFVSLNNNCRLKVIQKSYQKKERRGHLKVMEKSRVLCSLTYPLKKSKNSTKEQKLVRKRSREKCKGSKSKTSVHLLFICALFFQSCPLTFSNWGMIDETLPKYPLTKCLLRCPDTNIHVLPVHRANQTSQNDQSEQLELSENGHPITQPSNDTSSEHLANSDPSVDDNYMIVASNVPRYPTNPTASGWISENGNQVTHPSNDAQSTLNISISSPIRLEPFHVSRQPEYDHDVDNILNSISIRNVRTESPDNPTTRCNIVTSSECSQITRHLLVGRGQEQSEQNASNWRQRGTEPSPTVRLQNIRQNRSNIRWDTGLQLPCAMQGTGLFQDTCTVDNFLTIVYLSLLDRALRQMCQTSASPYDKTLYNIYISIENGRFDEARQHWLIFISHPRSSGSLYGTERKIIHGHVTHSCDASNFCKRHSCICLRESLSTGAIQLVRHQHFRQMYNRTTDRQGLLQTLIDNEVQRIQTCDSDSDMLGITRRIYENRNRCRFCRRVFEPPSPVFLTIDVEQIKDHLGNIDSVPETVHFNGQRYRLAGVTFHSRAGRGHFAAMVVHQSRRWRYCNSSPRLAPFTGQDARESLSFIIYRID